MRKINVRDIPDEVYKLLVNSYVPPQKTNISIEEVVAAVREVRDHS